jgi:hypothetical protein
MQCIAAKSTIIIMNMQDDITTHFSLSISIFMYLVAFHLLSFTLLHLVSNVLQILSNEKLERSKNSEKYEMKKKKSLFFLNFSKVIRSSHLNKAKCER